MRRYLLISILTLVSIGPLMAEHIKGGELYYEYIGPGNGPNTSIYRLNLKLYIDCLANSPGQLDDFISFTIFSRADNTQYGDTVRSPMTSETFIKFDPASNPCISNAPTDVCYRIRVYTSRPIELPNSVKGYTI